MVEEPNTEGIVSYGAYIPRLRIDRKLIYKAVGRLNPATFMKGEKAVANFDEDNLTMADAAGIECLKCFGHPRGASGLRMMYEMYKQLQGKAGERQLADPRIGLTHNMGGFPSMNPISMSIVGL
jgi:hypothetical protein